MLSHYPLENSLSTLSTDTCCKSYILLIKVCREYTLSGCFLCSFLPLPFSAFAGIFERVVSSLCLGNRVPIPVPLLTVFSCSSHAASSLPSKTSADPQFPVPECQTKHGKGSLPFTLVLKPLLVLKCQESPLRWFVPAMWQWQCHSRHQLLLGVRCLWSCHNAEVQESPVPQVLCHFPARTWLLPGKHAGYAAAPAPLLLCSGRTGSFLA